MRLRLWGISFLFVLMYAAYASADPAGAATTIKTNEQGSDDSVAQVNAQAGNVTQLDINQTKITDVWQGFYGNISGEIVLQDSSQNTFYNWTYASTTGEVFASRSTVSDWSSVACTTNATMAAEQSTLSINNAWSDSINKTFTRSDHPNFEVAGTSLSGCFSTQAYNSAGVGTFWNAMITDTGNNVVYTAIISADTTGFDGTAYDFEMLVPVQYGATSLYNFYVELQ